MNILTKKRIPSERSAWRWGRTSRLLLSVMAMLTIINLACPQNAAAQAPVLTGSNSATAWLGTTIIVDPNLIITGTGSIDAAYAYFDIAAGGYVSGQDQLVYPASLHGVTSTFIATTGTLKLTGTATLAQYQEILRTIRYSNTTPTPSAVKRVVSFTLGDALPFTPCGAPVQHYYRYVNATSITWQAANTASNSASHFGLQGYLATVMCVEENNFAFNAIAQSGWVGASDDIGFNGTYTPNGEGAWYWVTGPEAGLRFWQGGPSGSIVGGIYNNWAGGEPNNSGAENFAHFLPNGKWNDFAFNNGTIQGYYVEFGGMANEPVLQITSTRDVFINPALNAPAGVTTGLNLWLKADAGVTQASGNVSQWADQTYNTNIQATAAVPSVDITLQTATVNYNPSVSFLGTTGKVLRGISDVDFMATKANIYFVAKDNGTSANTGGVFSTYGVTEPGPGIAWSGASANNGRYVLDGDGCGGAANASTAINNYRLFRGEYGSVTSTVGGNIRIDGLELPPLSGCLLGTGTARNFEIGGRTFINNLTQRVFKGDISEIIVFGGTQTTLERSKVESHLAIKYGITLDQTTAQNYILSDGTVVWNATTAGAYNKNIVVMTRDDAGKLYQKQSRSVNVDRKATIMVASGAIPASNQVNAATSADKTYTAISDNGASLNLSAMTPLTGVVGVNLISAKRWQMQFSTQHTVVMHLDALGYINTNPADYKIVVSLVPDFSTIAYSINAVTGNPAIDAEFTSVRNLYFNNVTNNSNPVVYFALAYKNPFDLVTVNWNTDATNDGKSNGTIGVAPVNFTSNALGANGGSVFATTWATNTCTNDVIGVTSVDVVNEATGIDWSNGAQNYANVSFGGYKLTDPFLFFNFTNAQPFKITFPAGTVLTLLDSNPAGVVITGNEISVPAGTDVANSGFAIKLTGIFSRIVYTINSDNSDVITNSVGFTIGVETNKITAPAGPITTAPGGVGIDLNFWVKANDGVTGTTAVTGWKEQTRNTNLVATGTASPALNNSAINFNPSIGFNGTSNYMDLVGGTLGTATYNDLNVYVVGNKTVVQSSFLFRESVNRATGVLRSRRISMHTPWAGKYFVFDAGYADQPERIALQSPVDVNVPHLLAGLSGTSVSALGAGKQGLVYNNKTLGIDNTAAPFTGLGADFRLGYGNIAGDLFYHKGQVGELVMYTGQLTTEEHQRIQSYLAIKYGITLDQSKPYDYVFSDETDMWDSALNGVYNKDIAGIARDDKSALMQVKSMSVNAGELLTVNYNAAATLPTNLTAHSWANNGANTNMDAIAGNKMHMNRIWQIQENTAFGALQYIIPATTSALYMLVDNDGDFSAGATVINAVVSGTDLVFSANVANGQYITFARNKPATVGPGGVTTGVSFWLTGGQGVTTSPTPNVTGWEDQTGNGKNATATGSDTPALVSPQTNFNPGLVFDGTKKVTIAGGILGTTPLTDLNFYAVSSNTNLATQSFLFKESIGALSNQRVSAHAPWTDGNFIFDVDATTSRVQNPWGGILSIPNIWALPYSTTSTFVSATHKQNIVRDGLAIANKTATVSAITGIGASFEIGAGHTGVISEVFAINRALNAAENARIQSYLAIKYGITLDQTTATNYVASDGTTITWNSANTGVYNRNIAGIGRDDNTALTQKQSRSVNIGAIVAMYLGNAFETNAQNTTTFPADKRFLVWANDNGSANFAAVTTTGLPASISNRMTRVWRTEENNGETGSVDVEFDLTGLGYTAQSTGSYKLLISGSNNFATATVVNAVALANGKVYFENVNFADDQFFTIGYNAPKAPGGVSANLGLWLKANEGVAQNESVQVWTDQAKGNLFTQYAANALPTYATSSLNYNPAVQFNGVNQAMRGNSVFGNLTYNHLNTYQVVTTDVVKTSFLYRESVAPASWLGQRISMHLPWTDGNVYWDAGNSVGANRLSAAWNTSAGRQNLWSALYATTNTALGAGNNQNIIRDGLTIGSDVTASPFTGNNSTFELGSGEGGYFHNGRIGEVVFYTGALTGIEHSRIQSYLAIKYGITLDQTTATNYVASDGTTLWFDAAAMGNHKFGITGIARDDASDLLQKQSVNATGKDIVGAGLSNVAMSNVINTSTIANDKQAFVWAHNNLPTTTLTTQLPANITSRMARVWRTREVGGDLGTMEIQFNLEGIAGYNTNLTSNYYLLVSTNNVDFSAATTTQAVAGGVAMAGKTIRFTGVNLSDGQFFTIGYNTPATPGGVSIGTGIWIGISPSPDNNVVDLSGNTPPDADFLQNAPIIVGTPTVSTGANNPNGLINFNKTITFDGGGYIRTASKIDAGTNPQMAVVGINLPDAALSVANNQGIWGEDNDDWDRFAYNSQTTLGQAGGASPTVPNFIKEGLVSLGTVQFDEDVANGSNVYVQGKSELTFTANHAPQTSGEFVIGSIGTGATKEPFNFKGAIPEVITFPKKLTTVERNRVESYMALKYGITLNQSPAQNYFASDWDGTTGIRMWDAAPSGLYNKDIAGIGRDDKGNLYQKQSRSVNTGEIVTIGLGTIAIDNDANTNTISADKRFLVWANNGAGKDFATATYLTNLPTEVEYRMTRVWRVEENNGETGNVAVWFNITGLNYPSANALNYKLLISNSGTDFSTATIVNADSFVDGIVKFSGVNLNDGQFFTFAYDCQLTAGSIIGTQIICNGTAPAAFTSTGLPAGSSGVLVSYKWQRSNDNGTTWADLTSSNNTTYTSSVLTNTGTASLQILFRRVALGCNDRVSAPITVTVNPTLTPAIVITSATDADVRPTDRIIDQDASINLLAAASNTGVGLTTISPVIVTYQWKVDGKNIVGATALTYTLTDAILIATAGKKAQYNVTIQLTTNYPCATISTVETAVSLVQVVRPLVMPNIFTPNGDGKNDFFDVLLGVVPINAKLTIVDLRNNTMYESNNVSELMSKGWDGTVKNDGSNLAPSNVRYAWFISYETPTGKSIKEKGYINIQR